MTEDLDKSESGKTKRSSLVEKTALAEPSERLRRLFDLLEEIALAAEETLGMPRATQPMVLFDLSILMRAVNTLKGIRILLEHAHWELASAGARQLFEMLVNVEYLASQADRKEAVSRYAKFGVLQTALHRMNEFEYEARHGLEVDESRKAQIEAFLSSDFQEFREKNHWMRSWTGKNARELAKLSKRPPRLDQYRLLFSSWSKQIHGSPGAIVPSIFNQLREDSTESPIAAEEREIIELAGMGVTMLLDLWRNLPNVPALDPTKAAGWLEQIRTLTNAVGVAPSANGDK